MSDALSSYLIERAATVFDWRSNNCGHFIAGWLARARGLDVPLGRLGALRSVGSCERAFCRAGYGGFANCAAAFADEIGLGAVAPCEAVRGDIGLIRVTTRKRKRALALAIRTSLGWTGQSALGLTSGAAVAELVWRV